MNVEEFNRVFGFKEPLMADCAPVFFAGDVKTMEFCLLGLNPAYDERNYRKECRHLLEKGWEQTYLNFFDLALKENIESDYYCLFSFFLAGFLARKKPEDGAQGFQLLSKEIVNLNLIPYHSHGISLPKPLTESQKELIFRYLNNLVDLVRLFPRRAVFMNGARFDLIHKEIGFRENSTPISVNTKLDIHTGECLFNKRAVWFDKFISFRVFDKNETRKQFCEHLFDAGRETRDRLDLDFSRDLHW